MNPPKRFNARVREIGQEIFEFAREARPRFWHKSWWLERATRLLDADERLRTRAFQFVDCLPTLRTDDSLSRHLKEYFLDPPLRLPTIVRAALGPGPLRGVRRRVIARAARFGAVQMAGRFITGYDLPSVIRAMERLRADRMAFTLDVLGESTTSYLQADRYAGVYHQLIEHFGPITKQWRETPIIDRDDRGPMPRLNLSVKLTGLDPHFDAVDPDRAIREVSSRLRPLLRRAREQGAFVNIDMESTRHREITLDLFEHLLMEDGLRDWPDVGIVVQAYLKDGERDLHRLLQWGGKRDTPFTIRLVKGAYWDAETAAAVRNHQPLPVFNRKWETDACYERLIRLMFENIRLIRPAFASHNVRSLAVVRATAEQLGIPPLAYEIQTLYGMGDPLKHAMVELGQCVRVYCPYGDLMPGMGYLIRRLLENTSNEGFLKQSFDERGSHQRLLADPRLLRPTSAPPPARHYQNTDPEEPMSDFKNASNTSFAAAENRKCMLGALQYVRGDFGRSYPIVIHDQPVTQDAWFDSINPSRPAEVVGRIAQATRTEIDLAVSAARQAFAGWRTTTAALRADLLRKAAERLEMRRFELAATMVLEVGKPWREADADVTEAVDHWRYSADQIERIEARPRLRNLPGESNTLCYSPKGVCAVISPWAFPLAILSGMTSAALAAGNTVVMKPARQASVVAAKLVETLQGVGFPPGVVNFVPGAGAVIGQHLVEHRDVQIVAFTGSYVVGASVLRAGAMVQPGQAYIKKLIVEMGGKNAIVVDDDADLDGAVHAVIESAFSFAGQKCSSCSRLIVLSGVYEAFLQRLKEATESLPIGPAEEPSTMVGPVIDEPARKRILEYVEVARRNRQVYAEAKLPPICREGYYIAPTILVEVAPESRLAQEELFGPVLAVMRANDFEQALEIANNTRYALTGGVFSRSPAHIEKARREFAAGNLYINRRITGSQVDAQPFGGYKLSGTGVKAGSPDYLLHFMDARCITENTTRSGFVPHERSAAVG